MNHKLQPLFGTASWQTEHAGQPHGFSEAGGRHFFHLHKKRLVEEGAVTLLRGQWHVIEPKFSEVRMQIAAEQARRMVGVAA